METVYHYCPPDIFREIIKNLNIWYSDCTKMNDGDEYAIGYNLLKEIIETGFAYALPILNDITPSNLGDKFDILICSFSHKGDCLSLWRMYADDAAGFSVGISPDELFTGNLVERYCQKKDAVNGGTEIVPVIYSESVFKEKAGKLLKRWAFSEDEELRRKEVRLHALYHELIRLCVMYKSESYIDEREVRSLILKDDCTDGYETSFRNGKQGETKFHELNISFGETSYITEIVCGPKCNMSPNELKKILSDAGLENVRIKRSKIKYR